MASPHVAGVAALVRSLHPDMSPATVTAQLQRTAVAQACPPGRDYFPPGTTTPQTCYGGTANNGLSAVTRCGAVTTEARPRTSRNPQGPA